MGCSLQQEVLGSGVELGTAGGSAGLWGLGCALSEATVLVFSRVQVLVLPHAWACCGVVVPWKHNWFVRLLAACEVGDPQTMVVSILGSCVFDLLPIARQTGHRSCGCPVQVGLRLATVEWSGNCSSRLRVLAVAAGCIIVSGCSVVS